jgi:hypothetical protein
LYGDPGKADEKQSSFGCCRRKPGVIQVPTYFPKVISHHEFYICKLARRPSTEADIVLLEPTRPQRYGKAIAL